jgi:LacI family transcriptional regulator
MMKEIRIRFIADSSFGYNRKVLHGLSLYCRTHQWSLEPWTPGAATLPSIRGSADGFVIGPHALEGEFDRFLDRPAVTVSAHRADPPVPQVCSDDLAIGRLVADHLFDQGLRNLAFVGDPFGGWWSARRHAGFRDRARELGLTCLSFGADPPAPGHAPPATTGARDRACLAWLRKLPQPLGLMGCSDGSARHAIDLCRHLDLRVPEDVAVVGVDNDDVYIELTDPPLSSVALQTNRVGYAAGALLARLLAGQAPPPRPVIVPPGELIVRRSSDTLVIGDPVVARALQLIRKNLSEQAGVKQLLAQVPVSRSSLDARFRKALGRTMAEEIRRSRLGQAKHLLATSDLPMPEVARGAGFSCARQLSETFHHETGLTPTAYRRQFRLRGEQS